MRFIRIMQPAKPDSSSFPTEESAWAAIDGLWRPLYGSFAEQGVSVEWHDFQLDRDLDWARSFHPGSLEICLNYYGHARLYDGTAARELAPGMAALYTTRRNAPRAHRIAGTPHRFLTVEITPAFLRSECQSQLDLLKAPLRRFLEASEDVPPFLEICALNTALLAVRGAFLEPTVPASAVPMWHRAKVLEVLAQTVFQVATQGELFCTRHLRQNRDRAERALYLLERDLENPPSLEMLAQDVECSVSHLSRIFAEHTGQSIPKFLRTRRIERAAELLRVGKMNVTEAAMAVGYSSLSAFNKAFVEQMGCCPGLYPQARIACGRLPQSHQ